MVLLHTYEEHVLYNQCNPNVFLNNSIICKLLRSSYLKGRAKDPNQTVMLKESKRHQ